jgi:hypothetical protein
MKSIIIYDTTGYIIQQMTGNYRVPVGIPFLEVDVESYKGKIIKSVDVSVTSNILVFEDIPKTDLQLALERVEALETYVLDKETTNL